MVITILNLFMMLKSRAGYALLGHILLCTSKERAFDRERKALYGGTFFPNGVPNILRIFRTWGTKYSRIFYTGVHKSGDAKYPMTPAHLPDLGSSSGSLGVRCFEADRTKARG